MLDPEGLKAFQGSPFHDDHDSADSDILCERMPLFGPPREPPVTPLRVNISAEYSFMRVLTCR